MTSHTFLLYKTFTLPQIRSLRVRKRKKKLRQLNWIFSFRKIFSMENNKMQHWKVQILNVSILTTSKIKKCHIFAEQRCRNVFFERFRLPDIRSTEINWKCLIGSFYFGTKFEVSGRQKSLTAEKPEKNVISIQASTRSPQKKAVFNIYSPIQSECAARRPAKIGIYFGQCYNLIASYHPITIKYRDLVKIKPPEPGWGVYI